jgi:hypothetical protein
VRIEQRGYVAHVEFGQDRAAVICLTYYIAQSKEHVGVEFFEVIYTSSQKFGIPSARAATFQEELRTLHQAAGIAPVRDSEVLYIQQKLYEAYGAAAKVHIKRIEKEAV